MKKNRTHTSDVHAYEMQNNVLLHDMQERT